MCPRNTEEKKNFTTKTPIHQEDKEKGNHRDTENTEMREEVGNWAFDLISDSHPGTMGVDADYAGKRRALKTIVLFLSVLCVSVVIISWNSWSSLRLCGSISFSSWCLCVLMVQSLLLLLGVSAVRFLLVIGG